MPGVLRLGRRTTRLPVALERQLHDHIQYMEKLCTASLQEMSDALPLT